MRQEKLFSGNDSSTTATHTVSSSSGKIIVQAFATYISATMSGYDQTQRLAAGTSVASLIQGDAASAASVTFGTTINNSAPWSSIAVELNG